MNDLSFRRLLRRAVHPFFRPLAYRLDGGHMRMLGIRHTMRLARFYNGLFRRPLQKLRQQLYRSDWEQLVSANGPVPTAGQRVLRDGFYLDTSRSLPFLDALLEESDEILRQRAGKQPRDARYRAYFRNLLQNEDVLNCPSLLNFITSNEVLQPICQYLSFIPALSGSVPPGIRFVESGMHLDDEAHLGPRESQLYHVDFYDSPMVYVIVLLQDQVLEHGPFTFLSATHSELVIRKTGYWSKGKLYRMSDEEVYTHINPHSRLEMLYPRGTVLFIDPSRCLHYGARQASLPRHQLMFGLTSVCRADFSESYAPTYEYPTQAGDSQLRRMVVDRDWQPGS